MIKRVDHAHIVVQDMDKSIDFYTRVLGFRLVRRVQFGPDDGRRALAYVALGEFMLEFVQPAHDGEFRGTEARPLALAVDDLDSTMERFRDMGVDIAAEPAPSFSFTGRQAVIRDPSGLAIEVRQYGPADSPLSQDWQPTRADVVRMA